jgi:hypothetical protein
LSVRFAQCQILWLLDSLDFLMRLGRLVEFEAMLSTSVTSSSSETPSSRNLPLMALVLENSRIVNFNRMQDRLECACNTHDFYLMYIKPRWILSENEALSSFNFDHWCNSWLSLSPCSWLQMVCLGAQPSVVRLGWLWRSVPCLLPVCRLCLRCICFQVR